MVAGVVPNAGMFGLPERRTDVAGFVAEMEAVRKEEEVGGGRDGGGGGVGGGDGGEIEGSGSGDKEGGGGGGNEGGGGSGAGGGGGGVNEDGGMKKGGGGGDEDVAVAAPAPAPPPPPYVFVNVKPPLSPAAAPPANSTASTSTASLASDFPPLPAFFPADGSVKPIAHQFYMVRLLEYGSVGCVDATRYHVRATQDSQHTSHTLYSVILGLSSHLLTLSGSGVCV